MYLIVYDILGLNLASFFRSRLTKLVVNRSYRNYCSNPNTLLSYKSAIDSAISFDVTKGAQVHILVDNEENIRRLDTLNCELC